MPHSTGKFTCTDSKYEKSLQYGAERKDFDRRYTGLEKQHRTGEALVSAPRVLPPMLPPLLHEYPDDVQRKLS